MNVSKNKIFQLFLFFLHLIININSQTQSISLNDLDDSTQCYYMDKVTFGDSEEIIYELLNNKLDKILFLQFRAVLSVFIYKSDIEESNIIFSRVNEKKNSINYNFSVEKEVEKYFIKIQFLNSDINNLKMCFNLFDIKGNSFKTIPDKSQKIATFEIINSGKFPFFINDNLSSFTAIRINKKY